MWISAGVSSFIAGWLDRATIDEYIYIDIEDQHPDSMRFIKDCEKALGKHVQILKSEQYKNVEEAVLSFGGFINKYNHFAPCTNWLKKRVRKEWEEKHKEYEITYVWGLDYNETQRAERIRESSKEFNHCFPLIERGLTKENAHAILAQLGIKRPLMYEMGYNNNNCVGCIKGGMGYWNKIRIDFPEVFKKRADLERKIGFSILKNNDGSPLFLDELKEDRGEKPKKISTECDIFCYAMAEQWG